jgi:lipoprotein-anchoring transpeptidase ErfK/SrfK
MRRVWIVAIAIAAFSTCAEAAAQASKPSADPRAAAARDTATRILVSLRARQLWVIAATGDTLLTAPVAVGSGKTLRAGGRAWTFTTPRGVHVVLSKEEDPIWVRPDWAYVEVARKYGLRLVPLEPGKPVVVDDGRVLEIRNRIVGIVDADGGFSPLSTDDELVFGRVLYAPPIETQNRRVPGQLGRYRLSLGNGIGLHGTTDSRSIGRAVTHGCMRLHDIDLEWLYVNIPIGTRVYIF